MLHLVAFSPARSDLLEALLTCLGKADELVLLEDGCYFAGPAGEDLFAQLPPDCAVALIDSDAGPRGVTISRAVTSIDHDGLVALSERHQASLSWY